MSPVFSFGGIAGDFRQIAVKARGGSVEAPPSRGGASHSHDVAVNRTASGNGAAALPSSSDYSDISAWQMWYPP